MNHVFFIFTPVQWKIADFCWQVTHRRLLWDDCEADPSVKAIEREIVAIHCEDPPDAFSLSRNAGYVYQFEGEESHCWVQREFNPLDKEPPNDPTVKITHQIPPTPACVSRFT